MFAINKWFCALLCIDGNSYERVSLAVMVNDRGSPWYRLSVRGRHELAQHSQKVNLAPTRQWGQGHIATGPTYR
jgi:hypothetical protein